MERQPDRDRQIERTTSSCTLLVDDVAAVLTREAADCAVCAVITEGVVGDGGSMI